MALRDEMEWDHPDRIATEKAINDIEQWCINNGNKYVTKLRTWRKGAKNYKSFGFDEDRGFRTEGDYIIPIKVDRVVTANHRCNDCQSICISHVLFDWCVVCNKEPQVVHVGA